MRQYQSTDTLSFGRTVRKLFLSAFVIFTFLIYAVHERLAGPTQSASASGLPAAPVATQTTAAPATAANAVNPTAAPTAQAVDPTAANSSQPTVPPQPTDAAAAANTAVPDTAVPNTVAPPTAAPTTGGQYKDGQYTGSRVDAFYGWVQVQAVIQHGQISDVKFLEYPADRRTSQRINSIATPYLTQEAVQAQSANVDIISGATLTSEAFAQSLQNALQQAAQ